MEKMLAAVISSLMLGCGIPEHAQPIGDSTTPTSGEALVAATSSTDWVYWSFARSGTITVQDPSVSREWDLRFRRTQIGSNGGTSGGGSGAAVSTGTVDWNAVVECPAEGYQVDSMLPIPGPPGSGEYSGNPVLNEWFNYEPVTHAVSSKGLVYCVRCGAGQYAKVSIVSYAGGQMTIKWRYQPDGGRHFH